MQIQKRVLGLFAVIESPILVFSAQKELIYALWPRLVGFGRTVDRNQEKRQRQQELERETERETEQMLSQDLSQLLSEPDAPAEPAEPADSLETSVVDTALEMVDSEAVLAAPASVNADIDANANLSSAQLKRSGLGCSRFC